ncbi:PP2C family protein-serine/threonine phosphatase [Geodermatophilus sp. SYSU D00815]
MTGTQPLLLAAVAGLALDAAAGSVAGPRPDNQDAGLAAPRLVAVADGVGGSVGGATAAALVVDRLRRGAEFAGRAAPDLVGAVDAANADLAAAVVRDPALAGMATTLTAVALTPEGRLVVAHVGDGRALLLRRGELTRLTSDQTLVQSLLDGGVLTEEQARRHPLRSVVLSVLHGRPDDPAAVVLSALPAEPGDRLLLCTDGLSGAVPPEVLAAVLADEPSPDGAVRRLLEAALAAGTPDNVTAVVADVRIADPAALHPPALVGAVRELPRLP